MEVKSYSIGRSDGPALHRQVYPVAFDILNHALPHRSDAIGDGGGFRNLLNGGDAVHLKPKMIDPSGHIRVADQGNADIAIGQVYGAV